MLTGRGSGATRVEVVAWTGGVLGLVVLATLSRSPGSLPLLAAGALVLVNIILLRWARPATNRAATTQGRVVAMVAASWVLVALLPVHEFTRQTTQAAVSALSISTAAELVAFSGVGAMSAYLLRSYVSVVPIGVPLTALPVWVLASAAWGLTPAYAIGRGIEYVAMFLLASATAALATDRTQIDAIMTLFLRWTVRAAMTLVILGVAFGPLFVVMTKGNRGRFAWPGAHPSEAGFVLGFTLLVLVSTTSAHLKMPPWARMACVAGVAYALYDNQARTALAGVVLGVALLLVLQARRRPDRAALTGFFVVGGAVFAVLAAGAALGNYVLRDGGTERLTTLNGRSDLWGVGFDALDGPMDWFHGLGVGSTRVVFIDQFEFAGNAHNSALGTLVSLGVIGLALVVAALLRAGIELWRGGSMLESDHGPTLVALLAYTITSAATTDSLAEPHVGIVFLYLCTAFAIGWKHARPDESPEIPSAEESARA